MAKTIFRTGAIILFLFCCSGSKEYNSGTKGGEKVMEIKLTSPAFKDGDMMPSKYTCDGVNVSPPLQWEAVPQAAKSIAIICDDPDAPAGVWVHWVLYDLPAEINKLQENIPADKNLTNGARQGITDFRKIGYGGPCPPSGVHRYFFKIYALDKKTDLPAGANKSQLLEAMKGHILAQGQLVGRYKRR